MKLDKTNKLPLDQFINLALYDKDKGFYMKKSPFGKDGDFITAPNITRLFSEIIAVWTITFSDLEGLADSDSIVASL